MLKVQKEKKGQGSQARYKEYKALLANGIPIDVAHLQVYGTTEIYNKTIVIKRLSIKQNHLSNK